MNRKERRKTKIKNEKVETTFEHETKTALIILGAVALLIAIVYFVAAIVNGEIKFGQKDDIEETTIQYSEILAGSTFNQKENEYLVFFYDFTDNNANIYSTYISNYQTVVGSIPIYKVNLNSGFSANYLTTEESNKSPNDSSELKISGPTLIRISDMMVTNYIEGKDNINNYFNEISQ